jgi:DNA-binding transcriptional LysR family regulator
MRHSKLDLNLLNALRVLLKEKSVTRAGELLHVTQPAMSGILGRLRDYFDDPLIVPVGRKMDLTPLAESLLQPINDLLLRIDALARVAHSPRLLLRRYFLRMTGESQDLVSTGNQLGQNSGTGISGGSDQRDFHGFPRG